MISIPDECLVPVTYPRLDSFDTIAKNMLRYPVDKITINGKSKTIEPFLQHLRITRSKFEEIVDDKKVDYTDSYARTDTQLFYIKVTNKVKKEWKDILYQAYSSIDSSITHLYLVLPLQEQIVSLPLNKENESKNESKNDSNLGQQIQLDFKIGMHVSKLPSLVKTIKNMDTVHPFQIFLGSPTSYKLSISDEELYNASLEIKGKRVYVHSPYIINLCKDGNRNELLVRNIEYSVKLGCKGVVVHVGKSTDKELEKAMEYMRQTIKDALTFSTLECPLLLETPAGQGTETLTTQNDFLGFVQSFNDPRLAICVDTCHVFTNGHDPLIYLKNAYETGLLRLIHFNDSASKCGACVDRHAYIGTGYIGIEKMKKIGEFGSMVGIDMVIE